MKRRNFLKLVGAVCVAPALPGHGLTDKPRRIYRQLAASTTPLCEGVDPTAALVRAYEVGDIVRCGKMEYVCVTTK